MEIVPGVKVTPLEAKTITGYVGNGGRSWLAAAEDAGMADANAAASRVFNRPRVQSALNAIMGDAGATPRKIVDTYVKELDNPTHWQPRLHAADSLARIMGEFSNSDEKNASGVGNITINIVNMGNAFASDSVDKS